MSTTTSSSTPDTLTNLLTLLPTGTYLVFSTIVPVTTNNGVCNQAEKLVTGVFVFLFTFLCAFSSFTDSYAADDGTIWYGVVTTKGLWNPYFASGLPNVTGWTYTGGGTKYTLKLSDFYIATLSVISFLSLALLSTDLEDCYYPGINQTVLKAIPLPVISLSALLCSSRLRPDTASGLHLPSQQLHHLPPLALHLQQSQGRHICSHARTASMPLGREVKSTSF